MPAFAFADNEMEMNDWHKKVHKDVTEKFALSSDEKVSRDSTNELFKADDEVRIIVELNQNHL